MAIKSVLDLVEKKAYPCIKEWKRGDARIVVLFREPSKGTVLSIVNDSSWTVGDYYTSWSEGEFNLVFGNVILSNS